MREKYELVIEEQFTRNMEKIREWEEDAAGREIWNFYQKVIEIHFFKGDGNKDWQCGANTQLYTFLNKATGTSGDDHMDFVLGLQSFLANCILDDSYMTVEWFKIWVNPKDRYDFDVSRYVPCDKKDEGSFPVARWAGDAEGCQEIKTLEEALEHICNKEKARYKMLDEWERK